MVYWRNGEEGLFNFKNSAKLIVIQVRSNISFPHSSFYLSRFLFFTFLKVYSVCFIWFGLAGWFWLRFCFP